MLTNDSAMVPVWRSTDPYASGYGSWIFGYKASTGNKANKGRDGLSRFFRAFAHITRSIVKNGNMAGQNHPSNCATVRQKGWVG